MKKFAFIAAVALTPMMANADFTGDTVNGAIVGGPGAFGIAIPTAVVGTGVEFLVDFVGSPSHECDIDGANFRIYTVFPSNISTGAGETLVVSDLDAIGGGTIVGIDNFDTNASYTSASVTWTDDSITFAMAPHIWAPGEYVSFDVLLSGPPAFSLDVNGVCPGPMTFVTSNGTPGGLVAFAYGFSAGSTPVPPCTGLFLDIAGASLGGTAIADAAGNASFTTFVPAVACGNALIQAVDVPGCETSNVITP
jgi:hypothetical protein